MKLKAVFGPVPSRRLGFSLGIDPIPLKVCTMDCIYCQLGRTTRKTVKRECYLSPEEVLDEWEQLKDKVKNIDCIAIAGSGEPTLNSQMGKLIEILRNRVSFPIAVLTNGSLLFQREVRQELLNAHLVLPSLDAVTPEIFERINRPHSSLSIGEIIEGLRVFRRMYRGKMWLEVMLVKGVNDSPEELERLRTAIQGIGPDKVQLNTVVRPGNEGEARPIPFEELKKIQRYLGKGCEIISAIRKKRKTLRNENLEESIISMVKRHPLTISEIIQVLGRKRSEIITCLEQLHDRNVIEINYHQGKKYCKIRKVPLVSQERA
jgi:wyosine [tRNA(Phe)-imidazoG37] synthetase (radical SAM superfamily)